MKTLRILFTVLCAVCLAAIFPIGTFWEMGYALIALAAAGVFFLAMLYCKRKQESAEKGEQEPQPDFFQPKDGKNK
ncbi:MAG: hypothetical protein IJX81_06115 [Clostridia bacterium]|nr:hypothetical protein [Clostridia bacterium]